MRILWLGSGLLLPLDKGGKLRTYHLMRHLAKRHEITFLSFADPGQPRADYEGMSQVCAHLETIPRTDAGKRGLAFYAGAAAHLFDALPYAVAKYRSPAYARRLASLLRTGRYDLVVCDFLVPFVNMPPALPCPTVLFTHNVEAEIWRRHTETQRDPIRARLFGAQWRRMRRFEERALSAFDLVLAVSDADQQTFRRLYGGSFGAAIHVVPTGVDTSYFAPAEPSAADRRHLVFTGSMDWLPNEDGMVHFCREILPRIRAAEPGVTLEIVGRSPTAAVQRLARQEGISVTGRVDDVRPRIARGAVYVVPLRIGGGTRLKIFEAMSMGKAVVSTSVGAEGLPVTAGRDVAIADEPAAFADAVVRLLRDGGARAAMERAARALVLERYDWSVAGAVLETSLAGAASLSRWRSEDERVLVTT